MSIDIDVKFNQQSEIWLNSLKTRKRRPVSPATLRAFNSYVRRLTPILGDFKLAEINNGTLKQLVQRLDNERLSPKTIAELVSTVKQVVASLVDENTGEPLFRREWSARFIDCPTITNQKQYCATREDVERCIKEAATDQEKVLYAILAGSGLRIAEALAIHVNGRDDQTSWNLERGAIDVRSSIFSAHEIPRLKTLAARRTADLDPPLSDLIATFVEINGIQPGDYLFQARSGRAMHLKTARERLAKHEIPGFHAFRRYRITRLRELGCPEDIIKFWVGHAGRQSDITGQWEPETITDRYSKLSQNRDLRAAWAKRAGLGFVLPELHNAEEPAPHVDSTAKAESHAPPRAESIVEVVPEAMPYEASDDDLPVELFETAVEQVEQA